ncbi:MAG: GTP-binding protein [Ruminococcaceae bacterium]|nr:GTP-binding protein [Oscillospiraceae bacterium]
MTKIDIISGFLGAGKTTLIKKLIKEAFEGEKLVLIENEFGEIGIDGAFLKEAGINITEMNSGCICCSLVGDFGTALKKVLDEYHPDRIIIEPSGVGKLSDVIKAVKDLKIDDVSLNSFTTVVDATKCKVYMKNFGEFFNNQVENANSIVLSRTANIDEEKLHKAVELLKEHNESATIITTDWDKLDGKKILHTMEHKNTIESELRHLEHEHHHAHGEECHCHECEEHHHEHHHHHDEHCECGCHDHEHHHEHHHHEHHHHHADDVFTSWGKETATKYTLAQISDMLDELDNTEKYGTVLRAKGIVETTDEGWIQYDFVPGEKEIRGSGAEVIGRICVIGSNINEENLAELFRI